MGQRKAGEKDVELGKIPTSIGLRLEIPKIDKAILEDPSRLDEVVELKMTAVGQIQESVTDALKWLASVVVWLALCQPDPEDSAEEKAKKAMRYRISKDAVAKDQEKVLKYVDECLNQEEPIYKTAAAISYLNYTFSQEFATHREADDMLADLETRKLVVKDTKGPILVGYQRYRASSEFGILPEDLEQIQAAVAKFSRSFMQLTKQQRQEKTMEIMQEANISMEQFLKGVQGKFMLEVPAEFLGVDPDTGKEKWRGGGNLLLEVRGRDVLPVSCTGSIENMIARMIDMDVRLGHFTLQWERPPGHGRDAFSRMMDSIMRSRDVTEQEAEELLKKTQALWYLITRGLDAKTQEEAMKDLREFLSQNAPISAEDFYGFNETNAPKDGGAFLELGGSFELKGKKFYNVFMLVERSTGQDGVKYLEVVDAPPHVKELLGSLVMKGKLEEGENFMKLPPILQKVLRAIRGKTDLNVEVAKVG